MIAGENGCERRGLGVFPVDRSGGEELDVALAVPSGARNRFEHLKRLRLPALPLQQSDSSLGQIAGQRPGLVVLERPIEGTPELTNSE